MVLSHTGLGISKQPVSTGAQITMTRVAQHCNLVNTSDGPQLNKSGQGERERERVDSLPQRIPFGEVVFSNSIFEPKGGQLKQIAIRRPPIFFSFFRSKFLFSSLLFSHSFDSISVWFPRKCPLFNFFVSFPMFLTVVFLLLHFNPN